MTTPKKKYPKPTKEALSQNQLLSIMPHMDADAIVQILLQSNGWDQLLPQDENKVEYPTDPVEFMSKTLGYKMWPKLEEICRSVENNQRTIVESAFGCGKSVSAASIMCWWMLTRNPALVISIAPTFAQVNGIIWSYIRDVGRKAGFLGILETPRWKISDSVQAYGLSPRKSSDLDLTSLQGRHNKNLLVVLDEAAGLPRILWDTVLGLTVSESNRIICIGNPIEQAGPFWEASQNTSWSHIRISALDHPNVISGQELIDGAVTRNWVDERCKDWAIEVDPFTQEAIEIPWNGKWFRPMPIFYAKVLGIPPEQAEDQLIKLSWVTMAQDLNLDERSTETVIGFDPAPRGGDDNAMCIRRGNKVIAIKRRKSIDTNELVDWLQLEAREWNATKVYVDDVGCFDDKTEILTRLGWKLFSDISYSDEILTMNPESLDTSYSNPSKIFKYNYNGNMILCDGDTVNFCVTPNHNMYYKTQKGKKWKIDELQKIKENFLTMRRIAKFNGIKQDYFELPSIIKYMATLKKGTNKALTRNHTIREYTVNSKLIDMNLWLEFWGGS